MILNLNMSLPRLNKRSDDLTESTWYWKSQVSNPDLRILAVTFSLQTNNSQSFPYVL